MIEENSFTIILEKRLKRFVRRFISPIRSRPPASASTPRKDQQWSIGIYVGESPFAFRSPDNISNPVLTHADVSDVPAMFVADPFMLRGKHAWYMFFEVMNRQSGSGKGDIGLATSDDGLKWTYQQIVLTEPFHLSYPYVFEWANDYYMIPETYKANSIRLYKAVDFPTKWSFVETLLDGRDFVDSCIFQINDMWWLLTGHGTPPFRADVLRLYYADDPLGPWLEHPASPLIEGNPHIARPAGRVLVFNNRVIRYTQDCDPDYGTLVRAFEITELTTTSYREQEVDGNPVLTASGAGWNQSGMHHIDPHPLDGGRWMACVDGFLWQRPPTCT